MLKPKTTVKLRAADTVDEGLRFVVPDVLGDHLFFDLKVLELKQFWSQLNEAMTISENMRKAFQEKDVVVFQRHLDDYCERLYNWYGESYEPFMDMIA